MSEYDLTITRRDDAQTEFSYLLDWQQDAPMKVQSEPPDLPVSTSTGVTESGGAYSGRDAAPPYPIEVNNWQDGAGQPSYDMLNASPDAFTASHNIECSDAGHIEIGPRSFAYAYADSGSEIGNQSIYALGTFWAGFSPAASDPRNSVRYLVRYPIIAGSSSGDFLSTTTDTSFVTTDSTGLDDITGAVSDPSVAVGDYIYCPTHNEIVKVTSIASAPTLTVTRGSCGTTAAVHTAGERWYGFGWRSVTFADPDVVDPDDPDDPVVAFATDGGDLYAAFYAGSGASGEVWHGTASGDWLKFGDIQQVAAMTYCAGYLYVAQDNVSSHSQVMAVEDDGTTTHVLSAVGGLAPNTKTAGLVTLGNYVYWTITDGYSRSWVYRVQYSASSPVFELVSELPHGFVATSSIVALSQVYVGGYMDTHVTDADNAGDEQYHGYLYAIVSSSEVSVACKWTDVSDDYRIVALAGGGPNIYMLTPNDVRVYSTEHGGWWHLADVLTSSTTLSLDDIDWTTSGFDYEPGETNKKPTEEGAIYSDYASWDTDTDGFAELAQVVADSSSTPGFTSSVQTVTGGSHAESAYCMKVDHGNWRRFTLDGLPSSGYGTLEAGVNFVMSQGGSMVIAGANAEARVYFKGGYVGGVAKFKVGLRYCASGGASYVDTRWSDYVFSGGYSSAVRLTLDTASGAKVYINGSLALEASYDELLQVSGTDASKVWFACGWPGDAQTDTTDEEIYLHYVKFTSTAAYPPDYSATAVNVATKSLSFGEGRLLIPAPDSVASYIDPKENSGEGWLQTSESGLHMGTVDKYFTTAEVIHSPLKDGQTLTVSPYVDGVATGSTTFTGPSSDSGSTTDTATIAAEGKRLYIVVRLSDTDNDRCVNDRLRVTSITGRFFTANSMKLHTFILNCRKGVGTRNGNPWQRDPEDAIRHAFAIADSGEVVDVDCLWGSFSGRIEEAELSCGPPDNQRYNKMQGSLQLKVRNLDE